VNTGYSNYVADTWVTNHLARQFCHLPYAVPDATTMTNFVNLAATRNAGWIYVTDDSGSNPWDTLPSYWTNEVYYIQALNQSAPVTQIKLIGISNGMSSLRISGAPGVYELQTSSNLLQWSAATNISGTTSQINVLDVTATNEANRLYRTRQ
jgi:hypothetical protein